VVVVDGTGTGMTVRQAAFIGVGAMVGAGIFALLAPAGEVAAAAVWVSFLMAGMIALLHGYSFGKLGAKYPSGAGLLEYMARGFGDGHFTGITAWLAYGTQFIVTAMVAVSFGGYASALLADNDPVWAKVFAVLVVLLMALLNVVGTSAVNAVQGVIVRIVIGILVVFSIVTLATVDWSLLAPSGYPSLRVVFSSVALTFFAFLGFGVVTFTAKDLPNPSRQLPKAIFVALAIATTVYVAISLGVYGTLTVDQVVAAGSTAVAEAAKPTLGEAGFLLMAITALFATAGATNSGIYPVIGLSRDLADKGLFPPALGRRWGRVPVGLAVMVLGTLTLVLAFDLSAIASLGSAVALLIFTFVTISHLRIRTDTGARTAMLALALVATVAVLISFAATTLVEEPATALTLVGLLVLSVGLDNVWQRRRPTGTPPGTPEVEEPIPGTQPLPG
jgi:amino acid transporter